MEHRRNQSHCEVNSRLLRELEHAAERFANTVGVNRLFALQDYVTCLHRFTDSMLRLLDATYYASSELSRESVFDYIAQHRLLPSPEPAGVVAPTLVSHLLGTKSVGVVVADPESVLSANDSFLRIVGYTRGDLRAGRIRWPEMTPPEYRKVDEAGLQTLMATGACPLFRKSFWRKDGTTIPVMVGGTLLDKGSSPKWAAFILDLSDSRLMLNGPESSI